MSRINSAYIAAVIALFSISIGAQVNKCEISGKTVYQQEPCGRIGGTGGELKMVIPSTEAGYNLPPDIERLRQNYLNAQRKQDTLIAKHCSGKKLYEPVIGMSEDDLKCFKRFREPEKVNITTTGSGESKQYVFRDHGRATYLYFKNGILETMQGEQ